MTSIPFRIGEGHDTHRLEAGRPLILGGIEVPHEKGAVGHSDADVLLHSVTDALLGAIAAGDIGELFPDTAEENRGRNSAEFVSAALQEVTRAGWQIANLDCTIFAQQPKLSPFKQLIRQNLARLLEVSVDQVNVKAKTGERVGPIGREEAVGASASVLLVR
ncbi:MAG: 2-C-methyl-D-erythritol 2,4-cyclodiphosphate synthase [Rubinisphaera brasiliensis]|uniref:2-C-methyl-D-erythritol 2,4-cyclodiphosphate synthase n=1 Tax=Rubinisphaera brasiliensis TaxID=119 RepID=UPI003918A4C1